MATPAFDPKGKVLPASLTIVVYLSIIAISMMTMVKPAQASGTLQLGTKWCILPFQNQFPICGYATPAIACDAYTGSVSTQIPVSGYPIGTRYHCIGATGSSPGDTFIRYSCPVNSTGSGGACACNDPYVPDSAQTSCVAENSCPANMSGSPCACNAGYELDPSGTGCALAQYTLSLRTDSLDKVVPSGTANVIATVEKSVGGQTSPKSDVLVNIKVDVEAGSGGHDHDDGRHIPPYTGTLDRVTGTTSSEGKVGFTFNAPEISGTHNITVACVNLACSNNPQTIKINVKVDGLGTLTDSPDYVLIGAVENRHTDNHWLTAQARTNLFKIVNRYNMEYPDGPLLRLNDASLIWGGKFDIHGTWGKDSDHTGHRQGVEIDIRANQNPSAIPESRFKDFQSFAAKSGASASLHCNPPYSFTCPGCILDTGPNRHFHVYLLGR